MNFHFKKRNSAKHPHFLVGNPYTDWKILIILCFLAGLIIVGFSVYMFLGIQRGELFLVPVKELTSPRTLDQKFLQETLDEFRAKDQKFTELQNNGIEIANPN